MNPLTVEKRLVMEEESRSTLALSPAGDQLPQRYWFVCRTLDVLVLVQERRIGADTGLQLFTRMQLIMHR